MAIYYLTAHCLVDGIVEVDTATTETAGMYTLLCFCGAHEEAWALFCTSIDEVA